jgi:NADH:ubiquinone oxidoreductase subunit 6 (subunit J)
MADAVFLAMMVVTVGGAIIALEAEEIVYGAIGLAASLFGVAALFFLLDAPYVGVFQITVYVGAVAVLILFTVMLVKEEKWKKEAASRSATKLLGILLGVVVVLAFSLAVIGSNFSGETSLNNASGFLQIGQLISTSYAPVLLVMALVLAASVVGALTLSSQEEGDAGQ